MGGPEAPPRTLCLKPSTRETEPIVFSSVLLAIGADASRSSWIMELT